MIEIFIGTSEFGRVDQIPVDPADPWPAAFMCDATWADSVGTEWEAVPNMPHPMDVQRAPGGALAMRWTDSGSTCAYLPNEASYYGTRVYVLAAQT
ncbi:hypothetical protein [Tsukamurella tyrosinosolvens]|uniref:hypothetical protein n=1 Tax=Tsukamurella tyrosinosolvens TaxID=57704 RepID=UPI002DD4479A|nr:hypothetical protein [Tsukamurella tyrosinosolvens]MEC4615785.1 hypothetical protein [Tsukamurella tyrosinosolvens]